jgi:hypothetical protein
MSDVHPGPAGLQKTRRRKPGLPGQSLARTKDSSIEGSQPNLLAPRNGNEHREAYEIFQRAHHEWQTLERHRMQDGLQHLLRATELDPSLVAARVDLVNLCVAQASYGFMSPNPWRPTSCTAQL